MLLVEDVVYFNLKVVFTVSINTVFGGSSSQSWVKFFLTQEKWLIFRINSFNWSKKISETLW